MAEQKNASENSEAMVEKKAKNPNVKFVKFDMGKPKTIKIDPDGFISVGLFKEVKITFTKIDQQVDFATVRNAIVKSTNRVLSLMKVDGVKKYYSNEDFVPGWNLGFTVMIPFTGRHDMVVQNISRMIKTLNEERNVKYRIDVKNIAMLSIDTKKQSSNNVFIKGFVAASHELRKKTKIINDKPEVITTEVNTVKGQTFLSDSVWSDDEAIRDIKSYNRYSMTLNGMYIYSQKDARDPFHCSVPFKRGFKLVVYQIGDENNNDTKFVMKRNDVSLSLCLKEREDDPRKKNAIGVYVENVETNKSIDSFEDIFFNEQDFILSNNKYLNIDEKCFEIDMFKNDVKMIQEDIYSQIEKEDENPEPATSETEKPVVEEKGGKKDSKKKSKKEKKEEPVTEVPETPVDDEPVFNDVGSLVGCEGIEDESEVPDGEEE